MRVETLTQGSGESSSVAVDSKVMTRESGGTALPSFAEIFHAYRDRVWRTLCRLGVSDDDVDDLTQEVFVVVLRKLEEFRGDSELSTWVYGICARVAANYRRAPHRRHESLVEDVPEEFVAPTQETNLARDRAKLTLDRLLGLLDDDKRLTFVLFEIEQLNMHEVAQITGVPLSTAYYRVERAREQLAMQIRTLRRDEEEVR